MCIRDSRIVGQALGIPWGQVRVIKPYVGGGFGNKPVSYTHLMIVRNVLIVYLGILLAVMIWIQPVMGILAFGTAVLVFLYYHYKACLLYTSRCV